MSRSLQKCIERANAYAASEKPLKEESIQGIQTKPKQDTNTPAQSPPQGQVLVLADRKRVYTNGVVYSDAELWRRIHADPLLRLTQDWKMNANMVKGFIQDYGIQFVREVVKRVSERHDNYFIRPEPKAIQRGKLCRHIIISEGVPIKAV